MEFLVLPRMLALIVMMPLLCIYADLMGILGGLIVGVTMLDLNPDRLSQRDQGILQSDQRMDRAFLQRRLRGDHRPLRLPPRHTVRPERISRRRSDNIRGGDRHRQHRRGNSAHHHDLQCAGDIARERR